MDTVLATPEWILDATGARDGFRAATQFEQEQLASGEVNVDRTIGSGGMVPFGLYDESTFGATRDASHWDKATFNLDTEVCRRFGEITLPAFRKCLHPLVWTRMRDDLALLGPWDREQLEGLLDGSLVVEEETSDVVETPAAFGPTLDGIDAVFLEFRHYPWLFIDRVHVLPLITRPLGSTLRRQQGLDAFYRPILAMRQRLQRLAETSAPESIVAIQKLNLFKAVCRLFDNRQLGDAVSMRANALPSLFDRARVPIENPQATEMPLDQLTALRALEALGLRLDHDPP